MVHVAICGFEAESALGRMCARAFKSLGHQITYVSRSLRVPPLLGRLGYGVGALRERVVKSVTAADPDLVFVLKGYRLDHDTIERLGARTDAIVANWNPDNPFQVRSEPQRAESHIASLSAYDVVFTWGEFLVDDLREHGARRVEHLPFGYDPSLHHPTEVRPAYECDVVFLGHWSKKRERVLAHVAEMDGVEFDLWGNYWKFRCWNWTLRRARRGDALFGDPYAQAMASAKLVINVVADHNLPAYNMRTFEIPATQSVMLTTDTPGQREFFDHGTSTLLYEDGSDLTDQIRYYLDVDDERKSIAAAGHDRVQSHSYRDRMATVIDVFEDHR